MSYLSFTYDPYVTAVRQLQDPGGKWQAVENIYTGRGHCSALASPWSSREHGGWFDQPPRVRYAMSGLRTITVRRTPRRVGFLEIIYYF